MKTLCPNCGKDQLCFRGLVSDGKGGYKNGWECLNPETDCKDFSTEIKKDEVEAFNGG